MWFAGDPIAKQVTLRTREGCVDVESFRSAISLDFSKDKGADLTREALKLVADRKDLQFSYVEVWDHDFGEYVELEPSEPLASGSDYVVTFAYGSTKSQDVSRLSLLLHAQSSF